MWSLTRGTLTLGLFPELRELVPAGLQLRGILSKAKAFNGDGSENSFTPHEAEQGSRCNRPQKAFLSEAPVRWVGQEHKESTCMGGGQRTDGRREGLLSHRMGVGNPQRNVSGTGLGEKGVGQSAAWESTGLMPTGSRGAPASCHSLLESALVPLSLSRLVLCLRSLWAPNCLCHPT